MSLYKGTNLIAGNPNSANPDLSNITNVAKITIAHNAMLSDTYDILTIGASGTTYIAPADGMFQIWRTFSTTAGGAGWFQLQNRNTLEGDFIFGTGTLGAVVKVMAKKGDTVGLNYSTAGNPINNGLIFIYAQGSESEAN